MKMPFFLADERQNLRLQRVLIAIFTYLLADGILILYQAWGVFRLSLSETLALFGISFLINLIFIWLIVSNKNLRFKDPSLTIPQMVLAFLFAFAAHYFTNSHRGSYLIFYVFALTFGFFRLNRREFFCLGAYAVVGYTCTMFLLWYTHPQYVDIKFDVLRGFVLVITVLWFSLIGGYQYELRIKLKATLKSLEEANKKLNELATIDELTGINNRRELLKKLRNDILRAERFDLPLSVLMVDVDKFKQINDTYGHQRGDMVLQGMARVLSQNLRNVDYMGRYGGEEFLVVLPNTHKDGGLVVAEKLRKRIEEENFDGGIKATASFGVAELAKGEDLTSLVNRADEAMYQAKKMGRNKVVVG